MLGAYENFPKNIHKTAHFTTSTTNKKLQQNLIQTLKETNSQTFNLENIAEPSIPQCSVIFEFGIAETNNFNYLDEDEANKVTKIIQKKPLQIADFFCAIRYYKTQNEKKTPLKFDYYMIRFIFNKNLIETQIFHERGPRYMSPEDITKFILNRINQIFSRKTLTLLKPS
jgi:ribosomal protein S13